MTAVPEPLSPEVLHEMIELAVLAHGPVDCGQRDATAVASAVVAYLHGKTPTTELVLGAADAAAEARARFAEELIRQVGGTVEPSRYDTGNWVWVDSDGIDHCPDLARLTADEADRLRAILDPGRRDG